MAEEQISQVDTPNLESFIIDDKQLDVMDQYSEGDLIRIGQIKMASDYVYEYFKDILHDHRITLNEAEHARRIKTLLENVVHVFHLQGDKTPLANYFVANVLKSAQDAEAAYFNTDAYLPYTESQLLELYDRETVISIFSKMNVHDCCMYCGVFVSDKTEEHESIDTALNALLVGCDLYFVQTLKSQFLVQTFTDEFPDYEDEDVFLLAGKALLWAIMNIDIS